MLEQLALGANVVVTGHDSDGRRIVLGSGRNTVVDSGLRAVLEVLGNLDADEYAAGFLYGELGRGSTAVESTDTRLVTPMVRRSIVRDSVRVNTSGLLVLEAQYPSSTASFNIREAGLWMGSDASITLSTGTLFARVLLAVDNTAAQRDVSLTWTISVAAA